MWKGRRNARNDAPLDLSRAIAPWDQTVGRICIKLRCREDCLGAALGRKVAVDVAPFSRRGEADRHRPLADAKTFHGDQFEVFVVRPRAELTVKPRAGARMFR